MYIASQLHFKIYCGLPQLPGLSVRASGRDVGVVQAHHQVQRRRVQIDIVLNSYSMLATIKLAKQ